MFKITLSCQYKWNISMTIHLQNTPYTIYDNIVLRIQKQQPVTYEPYSHGIDWSWNVGCAWKHIFLVAFSWSVFAALKVYIVSVFSCVSGFSFSPSFLTGSCSHWFLHFCRSSYSWPVYPLSSWLEASI